DHSAPRLKILNAVTGLSRPETITVPPYKIGVMVFCVDRVVNGRFHRSSPEAADTPTRFSCVNTITWPVPSTSGTTGEPYDGPSPVQLHFAAPVAASNAVSAP